MRIPKSVREEIYKLPMFKGLSLQQCRNKLWWKMYKTDDVDFALDVITKVKEHEEKQSKKKVQLKEMLKELEVRNDC